MKDNTIRIKTCPRCGKTYHGAPALSREDNETYIWPGLWDEGSPRQYRCG